jgi:hypothetical protein
VPSPKNDDCELVYELVPPVSWVRKIERGALSPSRGCWDTDSVRPASVDVGEETPRYWARFWTRGFTSQYSNHEALSGWLEVLVILTSWTRTGSFPNGAYTFSPTATPDVDTE